MNNVIALPRTAAPGAPWGSVLRIVVRPALAAGLVAGAVAAAGTVMLTELFGISLGTASLS